MPAEPYTLLSTNDLGEFLNTSDCGAMTTLQITEVSHCEYADDIALTFNTTQHLQLQLDRFHNYTTLKGLMLNAYKIKTMAFFCSNSPVFQNVKKYLDTTLSHNGEMTEASNQMARNFAGVITRVWRIYSELGFKNKKHAILWTF